MDMVILQSTKNSILKESDKKYNPIDSVLLPVDGVTDVGPIIQSAYDAGAKVIKLLPNVNYFWNTPVFLDKTSQMSGLTIEGNKSTILLGGSLPTTNWSRDTTCKFAIFPNTKRSALSSGVVTVNDANRATGSVGSLRGLIVRDVTIDGQGADPRGFAFLNRTPASFEYVIHYQLRVGCTWWSYTDAINYNHCYMRRGNGPTGSSMMEQYQSGDCLTFVGCKQDGNVYLAKLDSNHGATFAATLGRIQIKDSNAVHIAGFHNEGQQTGENLVEIIRSQVTFDSCIFYETWNPDAAAITITDGGQTQTGSELYLDNCFSNQLFQPPESSNTEFSPLVDIVSSSDNTRISVKNLQGTQSGVGISAHRASIQGKIRSATAAIQSALDSARGRAAIASGTWSLYKTGTTWVADTGLGATIFTSQKQTSVPVIMQILANTGQVGGVMNSGDSYEYAVAAIDSLGNFSQVSTAVSATVTSSLMLQLLINIQTPQTVIIVWRKLGTGVLTAPDAVCLVPVRTARSYLFDTGNYLSGKPWVKTNIPVPNTVASSNNTVSAIVINGVTVSN